MGYEGNENNSRVDGILRTIQITSGCCVIFGIGAMICGILTLVFADPVWEFPYVSGHGLWAGLFCLLQGVFGLVLTRKHDHENARGSLVWVNVYRGMAQANTVTCGMHLGYAISGLVSCAVRSENGDGVEKCNAMEHDNQLAVQAASVGIGVFMMLLAFFGLFYLVCCGTAQAILNNPNYGKTCKSCGYE